MFDVGSIVYFKNPSHCGTIENTDIGYRWCLTKGCETVKTAPLSAAVAGILKSKFKVAKVHKNTKTAGYPNTDLIEVQSVDKADLTMLVVPEFLVASANASGILNSSEKRLLLYISALAEFSTTPPEATKETEDESEGDQKQSDVNGHDCSSCGKCSGAGQGRRNTTKDLKRLAEQWEETFSDGDCHHKEDFEEEPGTDIVDVDGLVDTVYSEVMRRLEAKKAEEKLKSFRNPYEYEPFYWVREVPVKRQAAREVPKTLDDLIGEFFW